MTTTSNRRAAVTLSDVLLLSRRTTVRSFAFTAQVEAIVTPVIVLIGDAFAPPPLLTGLS
jgi:hypothetical protein